MDLNYISVLMSLFLSSEAIQVISSSSEAYLPPPRGQAEILNSSLEGLKEVTLCARFNTDQFVSYQTDQFSYQTLITYHRSWLLASYVAVPCEEKYTGCTQYYKDKLGNKWRHSEVLGMPSSPKVEPHPPLPRLCGACG